MSWPLRGGATPRVTVTTNRTSGAPQVGDVLTINLPLGTDASSYTLMRDTGSGFTTIATTQTYTLVSGDIPPIGTSYNYRGVAVVSDIYSDAYISANPLRVPGAPTIGTATSSPGTMVVPFTAPVDNGGSAITGYKATLDDGSVATGASSPITFTGLTNGVTHTAVVQALNVVGYGAASASSNAVTPGVMTVDVLVYGATFAGVAAAIAAKKQGKNVLFVAPRNDLGGMMTSGIQSTDAFGNTYARATIPAASLSNELYTSLAVAYGRNQQAYYRDFSYSSESKTTLSKINALLTKYGVTFTPNAILQSINKVGTVVTGAVFSTVGVVNASAFVDATYTSDLYAMTGGDYYIGSEARTTYGETTTQGGYQLLGTQPVAAIDPYITPGVSASGMIKFVTAGALGTAGDAVPNLVQAGGFRISISATNAEKTTFPAPANYVAADYEMHRRHALANQQSATTISNFLSVRGVNSTTSLGKSDANIGAFVSVDYPNTAENAEYVAVGTTWARRAQIEANALQYTLGYIRFLQTDTSIPSAAQTDILRYGPCIDDYAATGRMPPFMYIREGLRAVGDNPVTSNDMLANSFTDPVGLSYYAFDAHTRQYLISPTGGDHVIQEGGTPSGIATSGAMTKIPMRVLFPKKTQVSNVLVTWGGNMSRSAYCALRVEPLMGILGEAAGIIAALAATNGTAIQDVPYASVAPIQNLYGQYVPGAATISADGTSWTGGTVSTSGFTSVANTGYGTTNQLSCSATTGTNTVTFTPTLPTSGNYNVQLKYNDSNNATTRGTISWVTTAAGVVETAVVINETYTTNNCGDWMTIGTFAFTTGDTANNKVVGTYNNSGTAANIIGVRFIPA